MWSFREWWGEGGRLTPPPFPNNKNNRWGMVVPSPSFPTPNIYLGILAYKRVTGRPLPGHYLQTDLWGSLNPPFNYARISIMHAPLIIVHPPSREATLLQLCTHHFHGKYKGKSIFGPKKCPSSMHPPGRRSDVPPIMQMQMRGVG